MTDRPILFSAPMIRALLDGRKTQTRRIIKLPTKGIYEHPQMGGWEASTVGGGASFTVERDGAHKPAPERPCVWHQTTGVTVVPPFANGDRLWVREAWRCNGWASDVATIFYRASEGDGYTAMCEQWPVADHKPLRVEAKWSPSLHMPRWASRLTLTVTDVRVQRLQEISAEDARDEGVDRRSGSVRQMWLFGATAEERAAIYLRACIWEYEQLWNAINGPDSWAANPWIVALTFAVERRNIDAARAA